MHGVKGISPKVKGLHPTGARADAGKSGVICGVTSYTERRLRDDLMGISKN
jgi:hypothetical protein